MSLKEFVQGLAPHFDRSRVIGDIDSLLEDLDENLLPSYSSASGMFRTKRAQSDVSKRHDATAARQLPMYRAFGHIGTISAVLKIQRDNLAVLEKLASDLFVRDITKDALTYRRVAVLQYLTALRFACDYAGRHLLRLVALEEALVTKTPPDEQLAPVDREFLDTNVELFYTTLKALHIPPQELAEKLGRVQDLTVIVDKVRLVEETQGVETTDPLKLGLLGSAATSGLIYTIRSGIANWQFNNHQAQISERRALQLRLLSLKEAHAGKNDPKLKEQIQYNEGRLSRLTQEIDEFRSRYG